MVCGQLPWNVLEFWLEIFWVVSHKVLFEARHVPWFAGGYHGTVWTSHGLRLATMERFGLGESS